MTKALFDKEQQAVTRTGDYYQICLNGEKKSIREENGTRTAWEYDYNEFRDATVMENEVRANPSAYLDYVPYTPGVPKDQEKSEIAKAVVALKAQQEQTDQALQELIVMMMEE